ncbi:hypothetical protein PUNSTDRAFT_47529 [Punctularia strigosozonata HHB-11173 SS5]|uniref:Uncharacterized protein n=1 Tax=Punctularia strigosozonata (strain HHB-11173) TaxID=741275 RepID=R7S398_PUNST|nr:uncharacterized protein PUNSTDRAFT_47529 [Punctularia strigosozonata HHB-11173 SS5]EIN04242.1 hypothetical protein PUNSTDRAFT_47529 [Punctularia strigosozonata HHB-11173 SS5]
MREVDRADHNARQCPSRAPELHDPSALLVPPAAARDDGGGYVRRRRRELAARPLGFDYPSPASSSGSSRSSSRSRSGTSNDELALGETWRTYLANRARRLGGGGGGGRGGATYDVGGSSYPLPGAVITGRSPNQRIALYEAGRIARPTETKVASEVLEVLRVLGCIRKEKGNAEKMREEHDQNGRRKGCAVPGCGEDFSSSTFFPAKANRTRARLRDGLFRATSGDIVPSEYIS